MSDNEIYDEYALNYEWDAELCTIDEHDLEDYQLEVA